MSEPTSFGEAMRTLRLNRRITLHSLAIEAGVTPVYLSDIERGKRDVPSTYVTYRIAKTLGTTMEALLGVPRLEEGE